MPFTSSCPQHAGPESGPSRIRQAGIVCAVILAAWAPGLLGRDLWTSDEIRWAQVARETLEDGHWAALSLLGRHYPDKPPLYFWANAGLMALAGGANELTPRLLSLVSTLGAALAILWLGAGLFGGRTGLWGALFFGLSLLAGALATSAALDPFYTLWLTLALAAAAKSVSAARWSSGRALVFCLGAAGATLTKGPVGAALPLAGLAAAWAAGVPLPRRSGWIALAALCAALAPLALWGALAARSAGWEALREQIREQAVRRALNSWDHKESPVYFLFTFWVDFFPASLLFPAAVAALFTGGARETGAPAAASSRARRAWRFLRGAAHKRPAEFFLLFWFFGVVLFHSLLSAKRGAYILPVFPAAALLIARWVTEERGASCASRRGIWWRRAARWSLGGISAAAALAAALHPFLFSAIAPRWAEECYRLPGFPLPDLAGWPAAALWASAALFAWFAWRLLRPSPLEEMEGRALAGITLAAGFSLLFLAGLIATPALNPAHSGSHLVEMVRPYVRDGNTPIFCRASNTAWTLTWKLRLKRPAILMDHGRLWRRTFLATPGPAVGIMRENDWRRYNYLVDGKSVRLLGIGSMGTNRYYVIGKEIAPAPGSPRIIWDPASGPK